MDVVFITTNAQNLNNVAVKNGQVIALRDCPGYYYDHDNTRWYVGGFIKVTQLPQLVDVLPGSSAIYMLLEDDGSMMPGLYLPDTDNNEWVCIASSGIGSDAPSDSRYYVRRNNQWVEPHATVYCTGSQSDVQRINTAIDQITSSAVTSGLVRVCGDLKFYNSAVSTQNHIIVSTVGESQSVTIDFSEANISTASSHASPIIEVTYRGSASYPTGRVQLVGLDATAVVGKILTVDTPQPVDLIQCKFVHGVNNTSAVVDVSNAGPLQLTSSIVVFPDTTTATTYPFMDVRVAEVPVNIHGNTFRMANMSSSVSEKILSVPDDWSSSYIFEDNMIFGSLTVTCIRSSTVTVLDTSYNNSVIS